MKTPEDTLAEYRARIDAIDEAVAKLLVERTGIIHEVALLKRAHWPNRCHIRPGREGQMHKNIFKRFNDTIFPVRGALSIWRQLIGTSTHMESPLNVTVMERDHQWLAREYFGTQIGIRHAATLAEALEHIREFQSNILILPNPTASDWWHDAATLEAEGLKIFAHLPVIEGGLPEGVKPAVALAVITPEPSGDDVSYHIVGEHLKMVDGFMPKTTSKSMFLGAHPRPIQL
jgi:chorismate mutase